MAKITDNDRMADILDKTAERLMGSVVPVAFTDAMRLVLGYQPGVSFTRMDVDRRMLMVRTIMVCISQFGGTSDWISWLFNSNRDEKVEFLRATAKRLRETEKELKTS